MTSFVKEVSKHIQSKKAKRKVEAELQFHLQQTTQKWMETGLDEEVAEQKAIKQMGNPVILGRDLNQLHSPGLLVYGRPLFIQIMMSLCVVMVVNIFSLFPGLMMNDVARDMIYGFIAVLTLFLYVFLGKRFLNALTHQVLLKSLAPILIINMSLGIIGYVMMYAGSGVTAENGQLPLMILMALNYGFSSIIDSISFLPEILKIVLLSSVAPLLLYVGSRSRRKTVEW